MIEAKQCQQNHVHDIQVPHQPQIPLTCYKTNYPILRAKTYCLQEGNIEDA